MSQFILRPQTVHGKTRTDVRHYQNRSDYSLIILENCGLFFCIKLHNSNAYKILASYLKNILTEKIDDKIGEYLAGFIRGR